MDNDYSKEILEGSQRALARVISWIENDDPRGLACLEDIYPHTGRAHIIGITGSPGAGKSSLTDKLTRNLRKRSLKVGIIVIDPSSPFTGGAILGDRIRMNELSTDPGVFIRSMATRGFMGGLSRATGNAVKVMDAFGNDVIIIETVGVGQDEVEIMNIAHTTCVVLVPGMGDVIQSMKAGLMEIADVFVINKSDRTGADQLYAETNFIVAQGADVKERKWLPPIVKTSAVNNEGIDDLAAAIESHRNHSEKEGSLDKKRRERIRQEMLQIIRDELFRLIHEDLKQNNRLEKIVEDIANNKETPYGIFNKIADEYLISRRKS